MVETSTVDSNGPKKLVVKVTAGDDAPERCAQAFTVAAIGVASGAQVSLWLTGESSWFALPGRAEQFVLPHSAPLEDLLSAVLESGTVRCARSARRVGTSPRRSAARRTNRRGATVRPEVLGDGVQALVY